jgi:hypothetical protein
MFAEANSAGLNSVEAHLRVSGRGCRQAQFVADRLRSQEPCTAQVTRQRGQHGDGGTGPFSKRAYGAEREISWFFHCSLLIVFSLSYESLRIANTHAEGMLGNVRRGCLCAFEHIDA